MQKQAPEYTLLKTVMLIYKSGFSCLSPAKGEARCLGPSQVLFKSHEVQTLNFPLLKYKPTD